MVMVLLVMLAGILIGFAINRFPRLTKVNARLISNATHLLQVLIITIGAISGSILTL